MDGEEGRRLLPLLQLEKRLTNQAREETTMKRYRMSVISEPAPNSRTIFTRTVPGPFIESGGSRDYTCGSCGDLLLKRVDRQQIQNIVFQCMCGAFNEIPRAHQTD
jgi:hypothetical protein